MIFFFLNIWANVPWIINIRCGITFVQSIHREIGIVFVQSLWIQLLFINQKWFDRLWFYTAIIFGIWYKCFTVAPIKNKNHMEFPTELDRNNKCNVHRPISPSHFRISSLDLETTESNPNTHLHLIHVKLRQIRKVCGNFLLIYKEPELQL